MKRSLSAGYELDDDPGRIDRVAVHAFLTTSYWAEGRTREVNDLLIDRAFRVVGLFHDGAQVGFARAVSDGITVAYLADVYVLPEHRGHGRGVELVRFMVAEGPLAEIRKWILHTSDAHNLYRKLGFTEPDARLLERWHPAP
ncbi:MAG: GNAT family N-acetyltransferase [Gaiellales bacterium]